MGCTQPDVGFICLILAHNCNQLRFTFCWGLRFEGRPAFVVERFGDDRRTEILAGFDPEMRHEDLIPDEQMVVTLTRGGYIKRTRADSYRRQHRGGKGIRGAQLRSDDVVEHFFVTSTHRWLLFFTNLGRVYRAKAYEIAEAGRDAKGQHVANVLALQPDEREEYVLLFEALGHQQQIPQE